MTPPHAYMMSYSTSSSAFGASSNAPRTVETPTCASTVTSTHTPHSLESHAQQTFHENNSTKIPTYSGEKLPLSSTQYVWRGALGVKKQRNQILWQERYCCIQGDMLYVYRSEFDQHSGLPLLKHSLRGCKVTSMMGSNGGGVITKNFQFMIQKETVVAAVSMDVENRSNNETNRHLDVEAVSEEPAPSYEFLRMFRARSYQEMQDWLYAFRLAACSPIVSQCSLRSLPEAFTMTILLVRHGQYEHPNESVTESLKRLTPLGEKQAFLTGCYLNDYFMSRTTIFQEQAAHLPIAYSILTRAAQTAQIVAGQLSTIPHELYATSLLAEAYPCHPFPEKTKSSLTKHEFYAMQEDSARMKHAMNAVFGCPHPTPDLNEKKEQQDDDDDNVNDGDDEENNAISSGVEHEEVDTNHEKEKEISLAQQEFENIFNPKASSTRFTDRYKVLVCHANVIRYFICQALGVNAEGHWGRIDIDHCSITKIRVHFPSGEMSLHGVNQTGHLAANLTTDR